MAALARNLTLSLVLCLIIGQVDAQSCGACEVCDRGINIIWPTTALSLAEDPLYSLCDSNSQAAASNGHLGNDLHSPDGENVYAVFDGVVTVVDVEPTDFADTWYDVGRYVILESDYTSPIGEKYYALYGHMMADGLAAVGEQLTAGDIVGKSGGGQNNTDRGDSQGPRLYFEFYKDDGTDFIDMNPFTCITDTCHYWYTREGAPPYTDCTPNLRNDQDCIVTEVVPCVNAPSYSCNRSVTNPRNPGIDNKFYVQARIDKYGQLDLTCYKTNSGETKCHTEVYDQGILPLIAGGANPSILNCFFRFIRVQGDGTYTCGKIEGTPGSGPTLPTASINWGAIPCENHIVGIGVSNLTQSRRPGIQRLFDITQTDTNEFNSYVTVGTEYLDLGVDDREYIDGVGRGRKYWDPTVTRVEAEGIVNMIDYSEYHTMVRYCDLEGPVTIKETCKTTKMQGIEGDFEPNPEINYNNLIDQMGYEECDYIIIDAGKYYDEPGRYLSSFWHGRFAAEKGLIYYRGNG